MSFDRTSQLMGPPRIPEVCRGQGISGLVSVLIPTYNRAYAIAKAIDSVLAQTYRPLEVVVVDDGSTDGTRELIARTYGDEVRYIHQDNGGLAAARNTGLAAARGEFIAFQDSDDQWLPWKLAAQVALMRARPDVAVTWTDMTAVSPAGEVVRARHLRTMYDAYEQVDIDAWMPLTGKLGEIWSECPPDLADVDYRYGEIFSPMFMGNLVHPPTALMRREHLAQVGGLDLRYARSCEDYEYFWRVSRFGPGALIEAPGMLYRVEAADQLTKPHLLLYVARGNLMAITRVLDSDRARVRLPEAQIQAHLADAHQWTAEEELFSANGRRGAALRSFFMTLRYRPARRRAWVMLFVGLTLPHWAIELLKTLKHWLAIAVV